LHLWRLLAWKIDLFKLEQPRLSGCYKIDITVAIDIHEQYQFVVEAGSMMCSFHRTLVYSPSCRRGFLESIYGFKQRLTCLLLEKGRNQKRCRKLARRDEIATMWRFTRNNGITEGFHTKMEVLQRQAYGFRNFQNYRLRVKVMCS
jgi:hypothetical protein